MLHRCKAGLHCDESMTVCAASVKVWQCPNFTCKRWLTVDLLRQSVRFIRLALMDAHTLWKLGCVRARWKVYASSLQSWLAL